MESVLPGAFAKLLEYGVAGIFIAYLIVKNWRLEVEMLAKDKAHAAEIKESMKERVDEAMKTVVTNGTLGPAVEKMAQAVGSMDNRLHQNNEQIAKLSGRIGE